MVSRSSRLRLSKVLFSTIHSLSDLIEKQQVKVAYTPSRSEYFVFSNQDKIRQTVKSLLYHAIRLAGDSGKVAIRATSMKGRRRVDKADLCKVSLCVSGSAVSEEMLEVLSERFQQINQILVTGQTKGKDFLLSDCRQFIRQVGGNVWVGGKVDNGLTFNFTLPVIKEIKLVNRKANTKPVKVVQPEATSSAALREKAA